jgi:hypothetical protein
MVAAPAITPCQDSGRPRVAGVGGDDRAPLPAGLSGVATSAAVPSTLSNAMRLAVSRPAKFSERCYIAVVSSC